MNNPVQSVPDPLEQHDWELQEEDDRYDQLEDDHNDYLSSWGEQ